MSKTSSGKTKMTVDLKASCDVIRWLLSLIYPPLTWL